jgi:hypothetical protein
MLAGRTPPLQDLAFAARLFGKLQVVLRRPIGSDEARQTVRRRLAHREGDFLDLLRQRVYGHPGSPYRRLLGSAGLELGDVAALVEREGLEGALGTLFRAGVYLSVGELKARQPVVRGSDSFTVDLEGLQARDLSVYIPAQTGGSGGARSAVPIDPARVRDWAVDKRLALEARGGLGWVHARWGVPGGGSLTQLMEYALVGAHVARWFSQVDSAGLDRRYVWSDRAFFWGSRLAGVRIPPPEYVPADRALVIADWMARTLATGRVAHLYTYSSPAISVCQAALDAGLDLRGAQLSLTGEPVTAARLALIHSAGAEARPHYGTIEAGLLGDGCLQPTAPDEVHFYQDLHALVQAGPSGSTNGFPRDALLLTSLRSSAPIMLLNASLGDQAELVSHFCGCPLEALGWPTRLHTIRGFEKLTAGGMTFVDADLVQVLERDLPRRFGGNPTQYQLVEEETADGRARLSLLVDPALGELDEAAVLETFLDAIGRGNGAERVMELQWRQSDLLRIARRCPEPTTTGKILHLRQVQTSR